jgi:transcription antitermination protein NusB
VGKRTKARECALQILYQWDITRWPIEKVMGRFWKVRSGTEEMKAMAERLARGAQGQVGRLDEAIARASSHWRLERIAPIDLDILRLGTYELMAEPATPASVIIDEAVELAKRFSEAEAPAFVNGVLDAIKREVRPEGGAAGPKPGPS